MSWLKKSELAVTFLDRYGNEIGNRGIKHNDSVTLHEMPDHLIKATLATEDRRFFDISASTFSARSAHFDQRAGRRRCTGRLTITQQLAKNLFLSNERTIERKINEAFLALWLETHLPRTKSSSCISTAPIWAAEPSASPRGAVLFRQSVRDVTLPEAAMLAGLFKAPSKFSPLVNLPAARARANVVLDNLVEAGFMSEGQVYGARRNPATPIDRSRKTRRITISTGRSTRCASSSTLSRNRSATVSLSCGPPSIPISSAMQSTRLNWRCGIWPRLWREPIGAGDRRSRRRGAGHGRRARLWSQPVQSRGRRVAAPGSSFKPYVYATALANGQFTPQRSSSTCRCASAIGARTIIPAVIPAL